MDWNRQFQVADVVVEGAPVADGVGARCFVIVVLNGVCRQRRAVWPAETKPVSKETYYRAKETYCVRTFEGLQCLDAS